MDIEKQNSNTMKELFSKNRDEINIPKVGDLIEGKIIKLSNTELVLDLGPLGTGIIYGAELKENKHLTKELKVGQTISAMVLDQEDEEGYVELSLKAAGLKQSWSEARAQKQANESITVQVMEANRGGLVIRFKEIIGFLPVSQLSPKNYPHIEGGDKNKIQQHLNNFIGEELQVKIIGLDKESDKLIVSEKAAMEKQNEEKLGKYNKGDVVEGTVTALTDFGAFIKFDDSLEGLAHISELDWKIIDHPRQILKEKEEIKAQIIDISDNGQVFLSLKSLQPDPWEGAEVKYANGQTVQGKVVKLSSSGAFIEIDKGINGLVRFADSTREEITPGQSLSRGESYEFEIVSVAPQEHKMFLKPSKIEK